MSIKQFNANYSAHDDRILFRFNTVEDTEFRFWFTRRVSLFILAATTHLIAKNLEQTHSPEAAKAIVDFGNESIQVEKGGQGENQVDAYQPASHFPLGADPLLVMDVKCSLEQQDQEDVLSLDLVLPGGANINLKMAGQTLHAMRALLNQFREHAAWGDVPQVQDVVATETPVTEKPKKQLFH